MDELYHYGVKGMKWGIRRTPEQLGHRSKKQSLNKTLGKDTPYSQNSKNRNRLVVEGGIIDKGTKLYRITAPNESSKKRKFVSFVENDNEQYLWNDDAFIPKTFPGKTVQVEYQAKRNLKIAGALDVIDAYTKSNPSFGNKKVSDLKEGYFTTDVDRFRKDFDGNKTVSQAVKSLSPDQTKKVLNFISKTSDDTNYYRLDDSSSESVFNYLKKKGFDGAVDITDAVYGDDAFVYPAVVFNTETLQKNSERKAW